MEKNDDRPAYPKILPLKDVERGADVCVQGAQSGENAFVFERSWSEQYVEGRMWIALEFEAHVAANGDKGSRCLWVVHHERDAFDPSPGRATVLVGDVELVDVQGTLGGQEHTVFVGDVEPMQFPKRKLPAFVGLYLVQKSSDEFVWNSVGYRSLHGPLKRLPVLAKHKPGVVGGRPTIRLDQDCVSVVQCDSEVMDRIPEDRRHMLGQLAPKASGRDFPSITLLLGARTAHVVYDVAPENRFKLVDVMFGPIKL